MTYGGHCSASNGWRPRSALRPSQCPHVGTECACQAIGCWVVQQDLEAVPMWLRGGFAPDRLGDRLLEPGCHGALIGIRRWVCSWRLGRPGDLTLEHANRPA